MTAPRPRGSQQSADPLDASSAIPDKLYFKIGEVARLVGVQAHVLRYWEKEVPAVRPIKSASNQRRYRRRHVEVFREIRRLLYEERYTLAGAKKRLQGPAAVAANDKADKPPEVSQRSGDEASAKVELLSGGHQLPLAIGGVPEKSRGTQVQPARMKRACDGLRELIQMAGEEP